MAEDWLDLVAELMQIVDERGDVEFLEVVKGDLYIRFARGSAIASGAAGPTVSFAPPLTVSSSLPISEARPVTAPTVAVEVKPTEAPISSEPEGDVAGTLLIRSPMVGTFFRAPAPGEPPFVELGEVVLPDTTVGLVEAMKVFTSVRPGVSGTIEEIFHNDGEFIEFEQPLFRVRLS